MIKRMAALATSRLASSTDRTISWRVVAKPGESGTY
jgi:hypothetical protein